MCWLTIARDRDRLRGFLRLRFDEQRDQIRHVEQSIRDACRHRRGHSQRAVDLDEVVGEVVQGHGRNVVLDLPAEPVRPKGPTTQTQPSSSVRTCGVLSCRPRLGRTAVDARAMRSRQSMRTSAGPAAHLARRVYEQDEKKERRLTGLLMTFIGAMVLSKGLDEPRVAALHFPDIARLMAGGAGLGIGLFGLVGRLNMSKSADSAKDQSHGSTT